MINPDTNYWIISPGENAQLWNDFLQQGMIAIGWNEMSDLKKYTDKKTIQNELKRIYNYNTTPSNNALALWEFSNEMKIGDIVYAKNGRKRIIGKGIIRGDYQFNPQLEPYHHTRSVEWIKTGEWPTDTQIAQKTLTKFTPYPEWIEKQKHLSMNEINLTY